MNFITYCSTAEEIHTLAGSNIKHVIFSPKQLSRIGTLDLRSINALARQASSCGLHPVLEWDILMRDKEFDQSLKVLNEVDWNIFKSVRVQDVGALEYFLKTEKKPLIQLNLEAGNRNLEGLKKWKAIVGNRLEKIVLSVELPKQQLANYIKELKVPVEILGLGPILLLYTPRPLLSGHEPFFDSEKLEAIASSEESYHKDFRVFENQHGTLFFHQKDYFLLDKIEELKAVGLDAIRIDLRLTKSVELLSRLTSLLKNFDGQSIEVFKNTYPVKTTRCFYNANATTELFSKLKNTDIQRRDEGFVGDIVEVEKSRHIIVHVRSQKNRLVPRRKYIFNTPEGEKIEREIAELTDLDRNSVQSAQAGDFAIIPYFKFITVGSTLYCETQA